MKLVHSSAQWANKTGAGERRIPVTLIASCLPLPTSCEAAYFTHPHDRVMWLHWLASSCWYSMGVRVCVMPTHWNEEGTESMTQPLKFKGEGRRYYNSLMTGEAVAMFKSDHVYKHTCQARKRQLISALNLFCFWVWLQILGAGKAGSKPWDCLDPMIELLGSRLSNHQC